MIALNLFIDFMRSNDPMPFFAGCLNESIDWFDVVIGGEGSAPAYTVYEFKDGSAITLENESCTVRFTDTVAHAMDVITNETGMEVLS